jgi:hypothetical protein
MKQIDIATVLRKMNITVDDDNPQSFSLDYVKDNGEIKSVKVATVNHKPGNEKHQRTRVTPRQYNFRENASVLIFNHDTNQHNTVKIPLIVRYNGIRVFH